MKHPLIERLLTTHGYPLLDTGTLAAALIDHAPAATVLFCTEDPHRFDETLDVAVVLPELARAFDGRLRPAVIARGIEKAVQSRYGFRTWPALVFVRPEGWLGTIEGVRNWDDFLRETAAILASAPRRAPGIGIPVAGTTDAACH